MRLLKKNLVSERRYLLLDSVLVIGKGPIGQIYIQILRDLGIRTIWASRDYPEVINSIGNEKITHVIVATPVLPMIDIVKNINKIFENDIQILVEKPFSYNRKSIELVSNINKNIFIGLNRRMYSNIIKLKTLFEDEIINTLHFDFSEPTVLFPENLSNMNYTDYENAFYYQSVHLIDLAFFLMGDPKFIQSETRGKFTRNGQGLCAGYGVSKQDVLFTFQANWNIPGFWNISITTDQSRVSLRSINQVEIIKFSQNKEDLKPTSIRYLDLESVDIKYKSGFYNQILAFTGLTQNQKSLCDLKQYLRLLKWMDIIASQH